MAFASCLVFFVTVLLHLIGGFSIKRSNYRPCGAVSNGVGTRATQTLGSTHAVLFNKSLESGHPPAKCDCAIERDTGYRLVDCALKTIKEDPRISLTHALIKSDVYEFPSDVFVDIKNPS